MARQIAFSNNRNKYNSKRSSFNGRTYDSALECNYAMQLDLRQKAGEIREIIPQFKLELYVAGIHICNYYVDFKVILENGDEEYHEVKGYETEVWKIKWKIAKALYGKEKFVLIK